MSGSAIRIDVLGTSLNVTADADLEYLESLLTQYKQHIENTRLLTGLNDPLKLAVLSGFLICDELEKSKKGLFSSDKKSSDSQDDASSGDTSQGDTSPEVEKLTLEMISMIDKALGEV
jgi:cell division protein ZapA (FtsZ GTPase activity inhibitor)